MLLCFRKSSSDILLHDGQSGCIIALYDCGKRLLLVAGSWPGELRNASGATPRLWDRTDSTPRCAIKGCTALWRHKGKLSRRSGGQGETPILPLGNRHVHQPTPPTRQVTGAKQVYASGITQNLHALRCSIALATPGALLPRPCSPPVTRRAERTSLGFAAARLVKQGAPLQPAPRPRPYI